MRIVFLLGSLGPGGAERVVSSLANRMDKLGHDIQIVCLRFPEIYYSVHDRVKVVLAMDHAGNELSKFFWLRKYIQGQHPDVVIPFTEGVYCFTIFTLLGTGIPVIASERLDPSAMSWQRKMLKRLLLPYADWLVVQTERMRSYFPKSIQKKASVIFNPVNNESGETPRVVDSEKLKRVISVGRLFPQKNQELMINAFSMVSSKFPEWQLVIFGEGPLRHQLEALTAKLGLGNRVLLPGKTDAVNDELERSEIFCLSSDYEGMSNAMIEAICKGLPIVTTNVSGTDELVTHGVNGLVSEIGDASGLAAHLELLMADESLRCQQGLASLEKANMFHLDSIVNEWLAVAEKVRRTTKKGR